MGSGGVDSCVLCWRDGRGLVGIKEGFPAHVTVATNGRLVNHTVRLCQICGFSYLNCDTVRAEVHAMVAAKTMGGLY